MIDTKSKLDQIDPLRTDLIWFENSLMIMSTSPQIVWVVSYMAIKCKPYSEITVESGTQLKTVHICRLFYFVYKRNIVIRVSRNLSSNDHHLIMGFVRLQSSVSKGRDKVISLVPVSLCSECNIFLWLESPSKVNLGGKKWQMVFCYQNCFDLQWEKIVLVIEKNFWNSRLKLWEFAKFLRSLEQFIQTVKGQNIFGNRILF